jgi:site-specific DNA recombinase
MRDLIRDLTRAAGYCRVSSQRQFTEGHGLERYIAQLKQHGLTDEQIFWDIESGTSEKREGYNRVLQLVRSGRIDKIIVPAFDRFTRSALGWEVAKNELQQFGVELLFLDGGSLDLESAEGIFTSRILAAMAAQLHDKNKYNAIAGAKYFREKRKIYKAVFGYIKAGDSVKPNTNQYRNSGKAYADVAREAITIFLDNGEIGGTIRKLVEKYGIERLSNKNYDDFPRDISAFKRWLKNPQLAGMICYYPTDKTRRTIVKGEHEAIISIEEHNEILRILSLRPSVRHAPKNPLSGLVTCGHCNSKMEMHSNVIKGKRYEHFRCQGYYAKPGRLKVCNIKKFFHVHQAIQSCTQALQQRAQEIGDGYIQETDTKLPAEVMELQQQIFELRQRNDLDLEGAIAAKELRLETLLRDSEINGVVDASRNQILKMIAGNAGFWQAATREQLTVIFQELILEVTCSVIVGKEVFSASFKI